MRLPLMLPWAMRAVWVVLPLTAGPSLGAALDTHSRPVQIVASTVLWAAWAGVVTATLIAHPIALTALRIVTPGAFAATLAAALDGSPSAPAVGSTALALAFAFLPDTGARYVNGPAYPNERRLPLRVPGPLLLGILPLSWLLAVGLPVTSVLLLAAGRWVPGGLVAIFGLPLAGLLLAAMHNLSRRWVVFVPAGLVVHDPVALAEPVLFRRAVVRRIGPVPAGAAVGDALDLTGRAAGLVIEIALDEPGELAVPPPGPRRRGRPEVVRADRVLITPLRPGALLTEARARRLPVGAATG